MKKILFSTILATSISTFGFAQTNRGRIQAQGSNPALEISKSWSTNSVPTKKEGIAMLEDLWDDLTATQKKERAKAYTDAKAFINNAGTTGICVTKTLKRSFQDPQRKDNTARIDIEIITGCAFKD
ncbi:hypothetical protein [Riemerella anatipestifer]|uniref:Uncharacterized protein n=1 Tax=Riemerella anatipestifer TaxID=34085 RepID=A0AAP6HGF8_RIEAN|nr:hypothetical protein [Riemerella anatipestifer]MCO7355913.1 hypothetical protein [Riemerella anatipestifer]MCU7541375.1 hypothetical protein [Riemerella anatipestifer]MCU7571614.1 hypothetical protein [Riemerella anatipestifer]MCU7598742.1 hypothetical protein [Riemerella anatipestifer]MCW0495566.1 hypothetical protein [Riemerella anatipestifer]